MSIIVKQVLEHCKRNMKNTYKDWEIALGAFQKIWTPANNPEIQQSIIELEEYMDVKRASKVGGG